MAKLENNQELASKGRSGDTMLAHINPHEAEMLRLMGGAGSVNPDTGLPEYKPSWRRVIRVAAVVVSIVYPPAAAIVGEFILSSAGVAGASTATILATGSAAISAGTVLATGGTPQEALKAGVAAATASGVSSSVASEIGQTATKSVTNVVSSAAGGAASGATSTALAGGDAQDILKGAAKGAVISGGAAGITEGAKSLAEPNPAGGLKASSTEGTNLAPTTSTNYGLSQNVPSAGGQGIYADPNIILPSSLSGYASAPSQMKDEQGALVPRYTSGTDYVTPPSLSGYGVNEATTTKTSEQTGLSPEAQRAISGAAGAGLNYLLTQPVPGAPSYTGDSGGAVSPAVSGISSSGATTGLTGARGAGEIESKQTGKPRQDVWNESSLRLKDALGV